jgi:glycosyltransferase involved in cell wall biosynthesis
MNAPTPLKAATLRPTSLVNSPKASGSIGYVLKRYPRFSETFVVNEILAHEAAGQSIEIFALGPVTETHFQDILGQVQAPVTRVPDTFKDAEAFWSLLRQAGAQLPAAWAALAAMDGERGKDVAQAACIALACRAKGIRHLHAHFGTVATSVARLAAAMAGISYSFTAHAKDIFCEYDEPQNFDAKLRDAARTVTVSDFNLAYLRDRHGVAASGVVRIYNGLDLKRFAYRPPHPEARGIVAVGRLIEKKGFHILVEAIRLLHKSGRDVPCRIIGGGEEREDLEAQIAANGLGGVVQLLGPRPQCQVIEALRGAAVMACPCIVGRDGNRDGLPTVLLEAMALGTPCIATDVTGIPELVRDGETGLCVPEGDAEVLAAGLARLLDDAALRDRVSRAGRALIEAEFDIARNAARLREVFADAMTSRAEPERGAA